MEIFNQVQITESDIMKPQVAISGFSMMASLFLVPAPHVTKMLCEHHPEWEDKLMLDLQVCVWESSV